MPKCQKTAPRPSELQHVPKLPKIVKLSENQIKQLPKCRQTRIREARDRVEMTRKTWLRRCECKRKSESRVAWYDGHSDDDVSKQGAKADLAVDEVYVDLFETKLRDAEEALEALRSAASVPPSPPTLRLPRPQCEDPRNQR